MSEWKTTNKQVIETFGNNFIEVSLKHPPEGENEFVAISKGWYTDEKEARYKSNILFTKDKKDEIIAAINAVCKE